MGDLVDHLADEFSTAELVLVAEALGLAPTSDWGARKIIDAIRIRLGKNGVPEDEPDDARQATLLDDFLYVGEWIDDDGNILKDEGGIDYPETVEEWMATKGILEKPACFEYADDADPSCRKCPLYVYCGEARIAALPPCYGVMYDGSEVECMECLEARYCIQGTQNSQ